MLLILLLIVLIINIVNSIIVSSSNDDIVSSYYSTIDTTLVNDELKISLKNLINNHTVLTYDQVWQGLAILDRYLINYPCNENETYIPDVYSNYCWRPDNSSTTGGQCGNYKKEGDCFNREHIWPKSWFGGFDNGSNAQTDLFELWGSDGYVNNLRGDLPLGNVLKTNVTYTSSNGCLIGICDVESYTGSCFEIANYMKGQVARTYFYLATSYYEEWLCCDTAGTNLSDIKPWMENVLRQWSKDYPVSSLEIERNNAVYSIQNNRNPFIDHPEWIDQINNF